MVTTQHYYLYKRKGNKKRKGNEKRNEKNNMKTNYTSCSI